MSRDQKTRKGGRPTKPATPGKRASLGLKVTPTVKQLLDAAARDNGRTQSQEAEARIERSFRNQQLLPEVLELAYGKRIAGLLLLVGSAMKDSMGFTSRLAHFGKPEGEAIDYPYAYDQMTTAVHDVLEALRPEGDKAAPIDLPPDVGPADAFNRIGRGVGTGLIMALVGQGATVDRNALGKLAADLLGEKAVGRAAETLAQSFKRGPR